MTPNPRQAALSALDTHRREDKKMNIFYASTVKYESPETALTGKQIKAMANISTGNQLYQDKFGDGPDLGIGDGEAVNIAESVKHFYAVPAATMRG